MNRISLLRYNALAGYTRLPAHVSIVEELAWYAHDVEQFQTTGFDARIWELYLFAALVELGFTLDRTRAAPDFSCWRAGIELFVEATTVNPTRGGRVIPTPRTPEEVREYLDGYAAIRFHDALSSKLRKEYWKKPHTTGRPLVLAVEDFHHPTAMTWTGTALRQYLYGVKVTVEGIDHGGQPIIGFEPIGTHRHGDREIRSGFFSRDDAEHISAVVFSSSGTMTKFNRIGFLAGFGSRLVKMTRLGTRFDPDPKAVAPKAFSAHVHAPDYVESWAEGMEVLHNPYARHPLPRGLFGAQVADHRFRDGKVETVGPVGASFGSVTIFTS